MSKFVCVEGKNYLELQGAVQAQIRMVEGQGYKAINQTHIYIEATGKHVVTVLFTAN